MRRWWPVRTDRRLEPRSLEPHGGFNGHARDQTMVDVLPWREIDTNRDPLHHFNVVAGRVFGWEQTEAFTRSRAQTIYVPFKCAAHGLDIDVDRLTGPHPAQLVFLEIGGDPYVVERYHRQQRFARLHALTRFDAFLADYATHGRGNPRVAVVEQGLIEFGLGLLNLRFAGSNVLQSCIGAGAIRIDRGPSYFRNTQALLVVLASGGTLGRKGLQPWNIIFSLSSGRFVCVDFAQRRLVLRLSRFHLRLALG